MNAHPRIFIEASNRPAHEGHQQITGRATMSYFLCHDGREAAMEAHTAKLAKTNAKPGFT